MLKNSEMVNFMLHIFNNFRLKKKKKHSFKSSKSFLGEFHSQEVSLKMSGQGEDSAAN